MRMLNYFSTIDKTVQNDNLIYQKKFFIPPLRNILKVGTELQ